MADPYRDPVRGPYIRERPNTIGWTVGILAVLLLIGAGFWAMNRDGGTTAANPPAVTASPSAAPGRPAPPPQETTGQAAPPAR
jgi:hypothetical protein